MNIKSLSASDNFRLAVMVVAVAAADFLLSMMNLGLGLDTGTVPEDPTAAEFIRFAGMPVLAPLGAVALIWRRRFPRTVTAVAALMGALSFSGIAFIVALYLLARRRLDWWVGALIVLVLVGEEFLGIEPLGWDGMLLGLVMLAAIAAWAGYRGQRARLSAARLTALKERADHAEAERAAEADRSKLAERHRIAREMHDTLAHRMSLVAVQAAALQVDAPDPETAGAARMIRETAHAALGELRDVLGVLHEDGSCDDEPAGPGRRAASVRTAAPGVAQIPGLLDQWRQAGIAVDHVPNPELDGVLPDAVSRAVFRVVQEGITNVARHAPDAQATVSLELRALEAETKEVRVTVSNDPGVPGEPARGAGLGLVGLAERVQLLGGTLEHGPTGGGFQLLARIPFNPVSLGVQEEIVQAEAVQEEAAP